MAATPIMKSLGHIVVLGYFGTLQNGCTDDHSVDGGSASDASGVGVFEVGDSSKTDVQPDQTADIVSDDSADATDNASGVVEPEDGDNNTGSLEASVTGAPLSDAAVGGLALDADTVEDTARDVGAPGPPDVVCQSTRTIEPGRNYGDYSVFAVRVGEEIEPGEYSVRARSDNDGNAWVFVEGAQVGEFKYDTSASLLDNTQQTLVVPGFFEFDLRSQVHSDLSHLAQSIFDGCHLIAVQDSMVISAGQTYGSILVEELVIESDAPSGTYTFFVESGNTGTVELRRDGSAVDSLTYDWQTTIGGGESYAFSFPGVLTLTVTRDMGTSNLFVMAASVFDGRHEVVVP